MTRHIAYPDRFDATHRRYGAVQSADRAHHGLDPSPPRGVAPCRLRPALRRGSPTRPQWVPEIKHDGYRLIAQKYAGRVRLFTRRGISRLICSVSDGGFLASWSPNA
jgi:hypothetical protein